MSASHLNQLLRSAARALLAQAALHGELIKVEWAEEKQRLMRMLIALLTGTIFLFMSLLSISAMLLIFSWDTQYRNAVLFALTGFYLLGTVLACYRFHSLAVLGKLAFTDTCAEIGADLALIRHKLGEGE